MKKVFVITMVVVLCVLSVVAVAASRRGNPSDHGVLLGSKIVDNMRIKFEMEPSKGMWMLMGGEWTWMGTMGKPYHLEVKLEDPYSGTRISYSNVTLTMINVTTGLGVESDMLHPMWGGSGLHYAINGYAMDGSPLENGEYLATVTADPPQFMRGESNKHLWLDSISADFRFKIRNGEILSGSVRVETYVDPLPEGGDKDFHVVVGDANFPDDDGNVMGVKVEFEDASKMYMPSGMAMDPPPGPNDIHLEVKLTDPLGSNTRIPYSDVNITLDNGVDSSVTHHLHAMWGGSGLHYGANAVIAPGTYDVTVDIGVPEFARSASDESLYMSPISATFSGYVHP